MKNAIDYNMKISLFKLSFMHLTILINCNMWRLEGDANITIKKSRDGGYMRNSQNIDADTITCMSDKIHKLCI